MNSEAKRAGWPTMTASQLESVRAYQAFVKAQNTLLSTSPSLTVQAALNEPDASPVSKHIQKLAEASREPLLRHDNKAQTLSNNLFTLEGHTESVTAVRFLRHSNRCVTASVDCSVRMWDLNSGKQLYGLRLHEHAVQCLAVAPDDNTFVSSDSAGNLMLFNTETGVRIETSKTIKGQYGGEPTKLVFTADGSRVITASRTHLWPGCPPGMVTVFNAADLKMLGTPLSYSLDRSVDTISPDGKLCLIGHFGNSDSHHHTFMDLGTNKWEVWNIDVTPGEEFDYWNDEIENLLLEPVGRSFYEQREGGAVEYEDYEGAFDQACRIVLVSGSGNRCIRHYVPRGGDSSIPFGRVFALDRVVATFKERPYLNGNSFVPKAELVTSTLLGHFPFGAPTGVYAEKLLVDGDDVRQPTLAAMCNGTVAHVWSLDGSGVKDGVNLPFTKLIGHTGAIQQLSFSPDAQLIATAAADHTIKIWSAARTIAAEGLPLLPAVSADGMRRGMCAISADGKQVLALVEDPKKPTAELWVDRELVTTFAPHVGLVYCVCMTPDGALAATTGADCTIAIYSCLRKVEVLTLEATSEAAEAPAFLGLAFSPTDPIIAAAGTDTTITIWRLHEPKESAGDWGSTLLCRLEGHARWVRCVAFSADGNTLASGGDDTIRTWTKTAPDKWEAARTQLQTAGAAYCISFAAYVDEDGKERRLVTSGTEMGSLAVHDIDERSTLPKWTKSCFRSEVTMLTIATGRDAANAPVELLLAGSAAEGVVKVFSLANAEAYCVYHVASGANGLGCLSLAPKPPSGDGTAMLVAFTSTGNLQQFTLLALGQKSVRSLSLDEKLAKAVQREYDPELRFPDPATWHYFGRREFAADAERDEKTQVGADAVKNKESTRWLVSKEDTTHGMTHARVLHKPRGARADGAGLCLTQVVPPGVYDVEWRVKPIKGGVVDDASIRTISFDAKVGSRGAEQQHVYEWSTEAQMANPWESGWSTLRVGTFQVLDRPRAVTLGWNTVGPKEHGPMTSGLDVPPQGFEPMTCTLALHTRLPGDANLHFDALTPFAVD